MEEKRPSEAKSSAQSSVRKPKLSDHVSITRKMKKLSLSDSKSSSVKQKVTKMGSSSLKKINKNSKKVIKKSKYSMLPKHSPMFGEGIKWTSLEHNGVIFPPPYTPHGVKILYGKGKDKKPVDLTPEQEEVATMFAVMKETPYRKDRVKADTFELNFWSDWSKILGKNHVIQNLGDCDFEPIFKWHEREKKKKDEMSTEEKKAINEEKMKLEEKYMWAFVDGEKKKVGNFRVEPPSLFQGRGYHPKMGKLKKRILPSDIVINIGKNTPVPECPIPGQSWKEVRHDNTVTWLAYWNNPINTKEFKYVFLAARNSLKRQNDRQIMKAEEEMFDRAAMSKTY